MSLQKIPHDTTKLRMNPVELVNIANRQRIGAMSSDLTKVSPIMTANNNPSPYVVSADSEFGTTFAAWKALDGINIDNDDCWSGASGSISTPSWWKIDFGSGKVVVGYKLSGYYTGEYYVTAWTLHGSNDDSTWTQLDSKTSQTLNGSLSSVYSFSNTTSYRYYKFIFTAAYGGVTRALVGEIEFYSTSTTYHNYIGA